jgi:hypothetical protein
MITQQRLKELLDYNPDTGNFTYKTTGYRNRQKIGDVAGSKYNNGYIIIKIDQKRYAAHRLAFMYMTGSFPINSIDHVDRVRGYNAWINLREATTSENMQNRDSLSKNNISGYLGVSYNKSMKRLKRWSAIIRVENKQKYIGLFYTAKEASEAYIKAKQIYHPFYNNICPVK